MNRHNLELRALLWEVFGSLTSLLLRKFCDVIRQKIHLKDFCCACEIWFLKLFWLKLIDILKRKKLLFQPEWHSFFSLQSKQGSPARSVAGRGSQPDLQNQASKHNLTNGRAASTTSIPQPSPNGPLTLSKLKMNSSDSNGLRGHHYPARKDVERSATADAHINQLRHEIESRLRINLPEDISIALTDGVILCHVANHVRPRAVPSIHVPSPSVVSWRNFFVDFFGN